MKRATAEALTHGDLRSDLENMLSQLEEPGEDGHLWVQDVTSAGEVVYQLRTEDGDQRLYARAFTIGDDDAITLGGERREVKRRTEYVDVQNAQESAGQVVDITESFADGDALGTAKVDAEEGIVRDVKLLGAASANGRTYSEAALQDAARLYGGTKVYFDHPGIAEERDRRHVGRSVRDLVGKVVAPRKVGESVRGDLHLLDPTGPEGRKVLAAAQRMPDAIGHSHRVRAVMSKDGTVVESIEAVASLDLVTAPATSSSLWESINEDPNTDEGTMKELKGITVEQLREARPDLVQSLLEEAKETQRAAQLEADNKRLQDRVEVLEGEKAVREREELMESKLQAAKLPAEMVTETFRAQLREAKDEEAVDVLIQERKDLVERARRGYARRQDGPRSTERTVEEAAGEEGGKREKYKGTAEELQEARTALFAG